jgi:hypothetical protein
LAAEDVARDAIAVSDIARVGPLPIDSISAIVVDGGYAPRAGRDFARAHSEILSTEFLGSDLVKFHDSPLHLGHVDVSLSSALREVP